MRDVFLQKGQEKVKKLKLEVNANNIPDDEAAERLKQSGILITPPINKDYWVVRVNLFEDQYVQAFPKFMTIGIGFAIEEDWNCNLPYINSTAERICNHIWHNRRYVAIKRKRTIRAIEMIQTFLKERL